MKKTLWLFACLMLLAKRVFCDLVADCKDKFAQSDWDGAITLCSQAIASKPDFADAYLGRGAAKFFKKDYNQAIKLKPDDDYLKSIFWFAQSESSQPVSMVHLHRGMSWEGAGDLDGAIGEYNQAIQSQPDFAEAYFHRGYARMKKGDLDAAIADETKAIQLKPDYARAYNDLAWCEFLQTNYSLAAVDATHAIELNATNRSSYDTRAWARYGLGDTNGALADAKKAVSLSQASWAAVVTEGLVCFLSRDYSKARQRWEKAYKDDSTKKYLLPMIEKAKAAELRPP